MYNPTRIEKVTLFLGGGLGYFAHETKAPGVPVWTVSIPPLAWTGEGFTWGFRGLVFRGLGV